MLFVFIEQSLTASRDQLKQQRKYCRLINEFIFLQNIGRQIVERQIK